LTAPVRLALGLGDQELEQRLRPALEADDDLVVVVHCLAADQVVHAVESKLVDVVVVASGLHRLSESVLVQLARACLPVVLLSAESDGLPSDDRSTVELPRDVDPNTLRQAIAAVARGDRWSARPFPVREPRGDPNPSPPTEETSGLSVIAVAGGAGSPGRTTVAIGLATALGAVAPTVLMDVDCSSPSVSAYLNRDPTRNVCTLAHAVRDDPHHWTLAVMHELQPLHPRSERCHQLGSNAGFLDAWCSQHSAPPLSGNTIALRPFTDGSRAGADLVSHGVRRRPEIDDGSEGDCVSIHALY